MFVRRPEAMVSRLIRCVRSGPKRPSATVPDTVWQLMQAVVSKILPALGHGAHCAPADVVPESSGRTLRAAGRRPAEASWRAGFRNTARIAPGRVPVSCGSIHVLLTRFGIRSVLPARRGTQKL